MKFGRFISGLVALFGAVFYLSAYAQTEIDSKINYIGKLGNKSVAVQIDLRSVDKADVPGTNDFYPDQIRAVRGIDIQIASRKAIVPLSVVADLYWFQKALLSEQGGQGLLRIYCGNGAESVVHEIYFDDRRVLSKIIRSPIDMSKKLQETKYYRIVVE